MMLLNTSAKGHSLAKDQKNYMKEMDRSPPDVPAESVAKSILPLTFYKMRNRTEKEGKYLEPSKLRPDINVTFPPVPVEELPAAKEMDPP